MRSAIAQEARAAQRAREARMTPSPRVRLALELGARDLALFAAANGLSLAEAYRALRRANQRGRVYYCEFHGEDGPAEGHERVVASIPGAGSGTKALHDITFQRVGSASRAA